MTRRKRAESRKLTKDKQNTELCLAWVFRDFTITAHLVQLPCTSSTIPTWQTLLGHSELAVEKKH